MADKARKAPVKPTSRKRGKAAAPRAAKPVVAANKRARQAVDESASTATTVVGLAAQASENTLNAANPIIGLQVGDIASAAKSLLKLIAGSPARATQHFGSYLAELGEVVRGKSTLAPDPKDRRFNDPAWQSNFLYRRLLQSWLATQKEFSGYVEQTEGDAREKGQAQFIVSLLTDALAPSNFLLGNPAALRKIIDTGGASVLKGARNLLHDARHNHMLPSQVDAAPFKVGGNLATTKGDVVFRNELLELIQYAPVSAEVHRRPLVMSPPQVNKFYAVDLTPDKSLIKWAVESGIQTFIVSWRNPTAEHRHWGISEYALALDEAVDVTRRITGSDDVNMWGTCSGGMTLAAYLGYLAARGERKVANTCWAVCVLDMSGALDGTTLGLFTSPAAIRAARAHSQKKGYVDGAEMQIMFAWLRPNDLIWNYWVNNYLLGNKPPAFDILAWNGDTTRLPAQYHSDLLDLIEKNPYVTPNALEIAGRSIDLRQVDVGAYVVGGITDHITPWKGCYGTARLFGEDSTFVLANAGHLQSLLNPPGAPKSFFFSGPAKEKSPDDWARAAVRHDGSWWPHWREWIKARSGDLVKAPKKTGSRKYPPLYASPGTYVFE